MKSNTPRVLILNYEYPPLGGGAANALYYLLCELANLGGVRVDLVTSSATGRFEIVQLADNVTVHKLAIKKSNRHFWTNKEVFSYSIRAMRYVGRLQKNNDFDLCHAFFAIPCGAIAYHFRRRLPYIVSLRGSDVPGFNARFKWMNLALKPVFRRVLGGAAAVQANSEALRQLAHLTSAKTPIEIIHNGVDCRQFSPATHPFRAGPHRLISVCRLIGRKGIDDLVCALPAVRRAVGDVELTMVGDGNLKESLSALAVSIGVAEDIKWVGAVDHDELPELLRQADLFVLPSHFEGMSNALLEAMAIGLPVVVTDTGGTAELVEGNGLVVKAGDPVALAGAIIDILRDEDERRLRGARSREIAEKFSWTNVARQYLEVYQKADGSISSGPDREGSTSARERYIEGHGRELANRASYLHSGHNLVNELVREIKSCLDPGAKILEVGCGGGHTAAALARLGFKVTATDFSPVAIEVARANYPGLDFVVADALELGCPDGDFDAVVAVELIEHLDKPVEHAQEVRRVLGPRGLYFVKTPNRLLHDLYYRKSDQASVWHPSVVSAKELARNLAAAGLETRFVKMKRLPDYQIEKAIFRLGPAGRLVKYVLKRAPVGLLPVGLQPSLIAVARKNDIKSR